MGREVCVKAVVVFMALVIWLIKAYDYITGNHHEDMEA